MAQSPPAVAGAIVGRRAELDALSALVHDLAGGRGGLCVVNGPAGMGKSTLVNAAATLAGGLGVAVVRGQAWEFADAPPGFALWPALRSLGIAPTELAVGAFGVWERIMAAVGTTTAPTLWVVEDVHAADELTLELLCFLAPAVRGLPLAVIATARPRDARLTDRGARRLTRLGREGLRVDLEPLTNPEIALIAERAYGGRLAGGELTRLLAVCGGNPLFARELARSRRGASPGALVPDAVRDLVASQLDALPPDTRWTLDAGAVLGRTFAAASLGQLLGQLPARVIDDLDAAVRAGLVDDLGDPARSADAERRNGWFQFSHALVHGAVYAAIPSGKRARWHELALASLPTDAPPAARAHHALAAAHDEDGAVALATVAAAAATRDGAHDRAFGLLRRAFELRHTRGGPGPTDEELLELAESAWRAGERAELEQRCREVLSGSPPAAHRARAALLLGAELRPAVVDPELVQHLEAAARALAADPTAAAHLVLQVEARLVAGLQPAAEPLEPVRRARAAIAAAEALGDPATLVHVLYFGGAAFAEFAPAGERVAAAQRLLALAPPGPARMAAHARLALDLLESGRLPEFHALVDDWLVEARTGHPRDAWRAWLVESMRASAQGDTARAEAALRELERVAGVVDETVLEMCLSAHRHGQARLLDDPALALRTLAQMSEGMRGVPVGRTLFQLLAASNAAWFGDATTASAELARGPYLQLAARDRLCWRLAAEAVACAGSADDARALLQTCPSPDQPELVAGHVPVTYDGPLDRCLGLLQLRAGDAVRGQALLRGALARVQSHGFGPWERRLRAELAQSAGAAPQPMHTSGPHEAPLAVTPGPPAHQPPLTLERTGAIWTLSGGRQPVRLEDRRGLHLLKRLLDAPGEDLHVLALAGDSEGPLADTDAGEVIDKAALDAYRKRLAAIGALLDQPPPGASAHRLDALRRERDALEDQVAAALGKRGLRRVGAASERARINVQRRLKDALQRIAEVDAALAARLERGLRTGLWCSYRPG